MAALTARKIARTRNVANTTREYPVAGTQKIWAGALVMLDSAGYAREAVALASNKGCKGWATATVDNLTGAAGAVKVPVAEGEIELTTSGLTQGAVGSLCYATSDQDIVLAKATTRPLVGEIVGFDSATSVWVLVGPGLRQS